MSALAFHRVERSAFEPFLKRIVAALIPVPELEAILVFGSYAADTLTRASDLDLACIVTDSGISQHLREKIRAVRTPADPPLDYAVYGRSEFESKKGVGGLAFEIASHGKSVWVRSA